MLVGRDSELAELERLLQAAREGRSGALVLRGEPGVGKSALLAHTVEAATGFTILQAAGVDGESELAYAALHQLLRPALHRVDELPEPQAAALRSAFALSDETVDERFRVLLGVLGLLAEVAEEQPLLCVVDDAQWLDQPSADAIAFVARRLEAESIALVLAIRDEGSPAAFERSLAVLELAPLKTTEARSLVTSRLGENVAAGVIDWITDSANGNPLALLELPTNLSAEQLSGREPLAGELPPATSVEEVYLERVQSLPAATQQLLLVAAAEETGRPATIVEAGRGLGLELSDLDAAEKAGLLQVDSHRVLFRHPLVRSAVYRAATFNDRERVHRALAANLTAPGDEDRRAWHLAAASVAPDETVARELERTADRARLRSGYAAAASALERAAELTPGDADRVRRVAAAAAAAWRSGRRERATSLLERARSEATDVAIRADIEHLRGAIEMRCGSLAEGCDILLEGAAAVAADDTAKALQMFLEAREAAGWAGDVARTATATTRATELPRGNDAASQFLADLVEGVGRLYEGDTAVGLPLVQDVIARADEFEVPMWLVWASAGARALGDEAREAALVRRAVTTARASGEVDSLTYVLLGSALMGLLGGQLEAADLAAEGLTLAREAGLPNAMATHLGMLAWFAAVRSHEDDCRARAREAITVGRPRGNGSASSLAEWALGLVELSRGRAEEAVGHLTAAASPEAGVGHPYFALMSAPDLVEAHVRSGRTEDAAAAAAMFEGFAQPGSPAWARALAARCRALLGAPEAAAAEFETAVELHVEAERRLDRARTELLYGEFLRRERRRIDARRHLRRALDEFENLGTAFWAERATSELRATGETSRKRDPSTLAELTPQELQIARLVAEGGSNKEIAAQLFLSPRTIDYHLRKVFMKLGIASRTELIRHGVTAGAEPALATPSA